MRQLLLVTLALGCCHSFSTSAEELSASQDQTQQRQTLNKAEAAQLAQQKMGGKILKIQRSQKQGRSGYSIKLLQDSGHVKQMWLDSSSGKIY